MNRSLRSLGVASAISIAALVALTIAPAASAQQWKPTKPITIIVPWAAGGSTDQVTRVTAAEIEKALGQKVIVVNQPGASGSIGTKNALEAPKDGYTWTAGAAQDLGTYAVLGMLDTKIGDWALFLNVANVSTLSVNPNTPYKTPNELIDAMKAKPGAISVATAGVNSSGHSAMEAIAKATGVKYKHVTYDGGNPAVVVDGRRRDRRDVAAHRRAGRDDPRQEAPRARGHRRQARRARRLRHHRAADEVGAGLQGARQLLRHLHPEGRAAGSDRHRREDLGRPDRRPPTALKQYATSRGAQFAPYAGADAQKAVFPAVQANAWAAADTGKAKVAPDTVGIPRP